MFRTLILTQGRLADELLAAAQRIQPKSLPNFEALGLGWDDTPELARAKVSAAIDRLDDGEGILILTDIFGSTPSNIALGFLEDDRPLEVLSGVNLMTVLRLSCLDQCDQTPAEAARWLREKTRDSICVGSEMTGGGYCGQKAGSGTVEVGRETAAEEGES